MPLSEANANSKQLPLYSAETQLASKTFKKFQNLKLWNSILWLSKFDIDSTRDYRLKKRTFINEIYFRVIVVLKEVLIPAGCMHLQLCW